jgi:hypothetical protein
MAKTRNSANQNKARQEVLSELCLKIVEQTREDGFLTKIAECVASYMKLVQHRNELCKLRENDVEDSKDPKTDFATLEELDRHCIVAAEKLYQAIPADHALKKRTVPLHLEVDNMAEMGAGDSTRSSPPERAKKPNVHEFDGRNSSWVWWKKMFETEMQTNPSLTLDQKFVHLLTAMKKNSFARKIVLNYAGVDEAFNLAWKNLCDHYLAENDLKCSHLRDLRDLKKKCKVGSPDKFRRLENLYQTAWGHVSALKALGAEPASYESLTIVGLSESLPYPLRVKFYREHDTNTSEHLVFEELLNFLKDEINAQRQASSMEERLERFDASTLKRNEDRPKPSERFHRNNRNSYRSRTIEPSSGKKGNHKLPKQSSMLQENEDSDDGLN